MNFAHTVLDPIEGRVIRVGDLSSGQSACHRCPAKSSTCHARCRKAGFAKNRPDPGKQGADLDGMVLVADLAVSLGYNAGAGGYWIKTGKITGVKIAGRLYVSEADAKAFVPPKSPRGRRAWKHGKG